MSSALQPDTIAVAVVSIIYLGDRFGLLDRFGLRHRTAGDAAAELAIAETTIGRLRDERNKARELVAALQAKTSLEPVLEQLAANARIEAEILDRLASHNGAFKHMEESLGEMAEGLRLLTGFVAGVTEVPIAKESTGADAPHRRQRR